MSDKATAIRPVGGDAFSELDNWLGIMDMDPPVSLPEKRMMYERLLDILADTLEGNDLEPDKIAYIPPNKTELYKEMRRIIEP